MRLAQPGALAFDPSGRLYMADRLNRRVLRLEPGGALVTVAGKDR